MRFLTRVLLLQFAVVVTVVAICSAAFALLAVQQVRHSAEASALNIARTVAASPPVRSLVAGWSSDPGTPDAAELADGALQALALDVADRTDALFVVIADDHGIRLAHPVPARLGEEVSTPYADVLAGNEVIDWETGTLGASARAKVPVFAPGSVAGDRAVGEVSVGFEAGSVFDDLPALLTAIAVSAVLALGLAALAGLLLRRRWERLTLGLQPEELVALVQQQAAVLDGVGDGVIALDERAVVRVCTTAAAEMLGLDDPVGRRLADLELPAEFIDAIATGLPRDGLVVAGRVLYLDVQPVRRGERTLGDVVIVRDRTDLVALSERLDSVRAMTSALRVQRHEFANRMHVAAGLIDADRVGDARVFLAELLERGTVDTAVAGMERLSDPFLQALVGAKAVEARERGVTLSIGEDTLLIGALEDVEDAAAIIGNLVDNAVTAAVAADEPRAVELTLLGDGDALVVTVADSGHGLDPGDDPFTRSARPGDGDAHSVHGLGIGLPLSRELARRRGGGLWIIDRGDDEGARTGARGTGAVFGARLPGVLRIDGTPRADNREVSLG